MNTIQDRNHLSNPLLWEIRVPGTSLCICAIKKPNYTKLPTDKAFAVVIWDPERGHQIIRMSIVDFMENPWAAAPEPTTIDAILSEGWIID